MSAFPPIASEVKSSDGGGGRGSSVSLWPPAKDDVQEDGASKGKEKLFDGNCAKEGETQDGSKKACSVEDSIVSQ